MSFFYNSKLTCFCFLLVSVDLLLEELLMRQGPLGGLPLLRRYGGGSGSGTRGRSVVPSLLLDEGAPCSEQSCSAS